MTPHFFIFKVSNGNHDWKHALFLDGKWYNFSWNWFCDHDAGRVHMNSPLSMWDGMLHGEIPADQVKWVVPESDSDDGPYFVQIRAAWLATKGIIVK